MLTFSQAMERFQFFERVGLAKKAQHLIQKIDNVLTCINIDRHRNVNTFLRIPTRLKLKLYKNEIIAASNDPDVRDVLSVAKFLEDNKGYLVHEIAKIDRVQWLETNIIQISESDSEDELPSLLDLPDIEPQASTYSQTEPHRSRTPVRGIRGFHRFRPYRSNSSTKERPTPTHTATVTLASCENRLASTSINEQSRNEREEIIKRIRENVRKEILQYLNCVNKDNDSVLVPCGHFYC